MKHFKEKGITLTALVVTIIVMLILAIISVNATIGENGIINKTFSSKISKEKQDASTDVIEGIKRIEYYANVSADRGVTLKGLLKTLNLEKYTNGKIHGIKTDGKNTIIYYSNNIGSYTITVDENGGTKTELGIVVKKNEVNNVEMTQDEKITLTSDEEISYWVVAGGDVNSVEINSITGEVTKKGEGTVVIYGYKSKEDAETGNYIEVTIKDKKEDTSNTIADSGENNGSIPEIIEEEEFVLEATVPMPGTPGPDYVGYLKIGEHSHIYLRNIDNKITLVLNVDNEAKGVVDVYDKYKNGITFEDVHYYKSLKPNCEDIEKIVIEDSVEEVPDYIFNDFINVKELYTGKNLNSLGKFVDDIDYSQAHKGLINLEYLDLNSSHLNGTLSDNVTHYVLYRPVLNNLSSISISGTGSQSLFGYTKLKEVRCGSNVRVISEHVFEGCSSLEIVYLNDSILRIYPFAFSRCTKLSDIYYTGNDLTDIGSSAFEFTLIKDIIKSSKLTKIDSFTYYACENITNINIPSNITNIEHHAFSVCDYLNSVTFNEGLLEIGKDAFNMCRRLENVNFNLSSSLKKIGYEGFRRCDSLENIEIPDCVEEIDGYAFSCCGQLRTIKFPKYLNNINTGMCFTSNLGNLKTIIWPEVDFEIGDKAFESCGFFSDLNIPNATKIGVRAFFGCRQLENLTLGYKCKEINEKAFANCINLVSVNFETTPNGEQKSYTSYETITFYDVNGDTYEYYDSYGLQNYFVPLNDGIEYIGIEAFYGCNSLESVILPDSISKLDRGCFGECSNLKEIVFNCHNCTYDNAWVDGIFYPINYYTSNDNYSVFNTISIGLTVDYIPDGIISYNNKIFNLTISKGVKNMGDNVFKNTPLLNEVTINASSHEELYENIKTKIPLGLNIGKNIWTIVFADVTRSGIGRSS